MKFSFQHKWPTLNLNLNAEVPLSGVTAVIGKSGSGKTSLLKFIAGLERPKSGELEFSGKSWQGANFFLPTHQRPIGYVFQNPSLFSHLNVKENLLFGYHQVPGERRNIKFDDVVSHLKLEPYLSLSTEQLSGGQQQRVAIGRALLTSPQVLLMDEPLSALDVMAKAEIIPYLREISEAFAMPIIYVSHHFDEVYQLASHLLVVENGRIVKQGDFHQVISQMELFKQYGTGISSVLEVKVVGYNPVFSVIEAESDGQRFLLVGDENPVGKTLRLKINPRDVSLSLERSENTSILNLLEMQVTEVLEVSSGSVLIKLKLGSQTLIAQISRMSQSRLALVPGQKVIAQVKAMSLLS